MKIYAIRDRLIDYFMVPFAAPSDKQVMAAVATNINGDQSADIKAAPHQFELWQLAELQEDGHIEPKKEIICNCAVLVRRDFRPNTNGRTDGSTPAAPEAHGDGHTRQTTTRGPGEAGDPYQPSTEIPAPSANGQNTTAPTGH